MERHVITDLTAINPPVFYDGTGRRWRRFLTFTGMTLGLCVVFLSVIIPQAASPTFAAPANQAASFPREAVASGSRPERAIPLVGDLEHGILTRIVRVERQGGQTLLADPFSNQVFRPATAVEVEAIGDQPYAQERFAKPAPGQLMLTFDDGPDPLYTPALLDLLSRNGVPATFFVLGDNVVKSPAIVDRMVREGHMVANHTMDHNPDFYSVSDEANRHALIATNRVIQAAAGYSTRLWRIPEGDPDNKPLAVMQGQQLGMLQIDFDLDTSDWELAGETIPTPQLDGNGHVVLMHDGGGDRSSTLDLTQRLIDEAKAQGYTFTTMSPILPPEYIPTAGVPRTLVDASVFTAVWATIVLPGQLLGWLTAFGIISLTSISALYLILAWCNHIHHNRRTWPDQETLPWATVILPAYNEGAVIKKSLDSLLASTYRRFKVIAVNDGSSDDTGNILDAYAATWPNLRVIHQANTGKAGALNAGIALADTNVIVTMDGDTIFEPGTIGYLLRNFTDPVMGVVGGHVKVGNRNNLLTWWQSLEYLVGICNVRMAEGALGAITIAPGACAAWNRRAVIQAGGFKEYTKAEDAELTLAIQRLSLGYKVRQENQAVARTEAPEKLRPLANQRLRWVFGNLQAFWVHKRMLLNPRYGMTGMAMAYSLATMAISLLFLPVIAVMSVLNLVNGEWQSLVVFAGLVAAIHLAQTVTALLMVGETGWHLLVVPIYRLIYEPLRAYLLYASVLHIVRGDGPAYNWNKLKRMNSVNALVPSDRRTVETP